MFLQDYHIYVRKEYPPHILRIAKIAKRKSRINSRAKTEQNQGQNVQPPHLKLKRKAGARKGNRNALKHGLYSSAMIAMRLEVRMAIAESKRAVAMARMAAALMDAETRRRLYAARESAASGSGSGSSVGAT